MRVLFAGLTSPYPPTNGHRLRTWALVRALVDEGHQVSVISLADTEEPIGDITPLQRIAEAVEVIPAPMRVTRGRDGIKRLLNLPSPRPFGAWKFRSPAFTAALERHLRRAAFDLVICDGVYNLPNLPGRLSIPVLLNKDDVAHVILERYAALERRVGPRNYIQIEARKVKRWERKASARVAGVLACSQHDRRILEALTPTARIFVVPNVVDTDHYIPGGVAEQRTVVFQGGLDWYPNLDGVEFFVTRVLPPLRRLVPDVIFRVAGRCPEDVRERFAHIAGVELTGRVADMRDEIRRATVCAVPLRIGSGTRLKILEAAAMAKPIVSTRLGAEGLDFANGEEILIADDPIAFASALAAILLDDSRQQTLGAAARLHVQKAYSQSVLQMSLREALDLVAGFHADVHRAPSRKVRTGCPTDVKGSYRGISW